MSGIVFAGPTLAGAFPGPRWRLRAPVAFGDLYAVVETEAPCRLILVDGFFEDRTAVWHKEILWAMEKGFEVWGVGSMGALRAVELEAFGMRGAGAVFEAFRDGRLDADDEVAVVHAPAELGYAPLSVALVDIRFTLQEAVDQGVAARATVDPLIVIGRRLWFKDRGYERLLAEGGAAGLDPRELRRLAAWLPTGAFSRKRQDSLALLERLAGAAPTPPRPIRVERTCYHQRALAGRGSGGKPCNPQA